MSAANGKSVSFGVRIPLKLYELLERIQSERGHVSRNDTVVEALTEYAHRYLWKQEKGR
jgi:metal-responsive CopG/Arc/MetJ family transcriptional regulator